jgi:hypothetical protein
MAPALWTTRWWRSISLCLVLVVAAGLFVRTFTALTGQDTGVDRERVIVWPSTPHSPNAQPIGRPSRPHPGCGPCTAGSGRGVLVQRTDEQQCMEYGP